MSERMRLLFVSGSQTRELTLILSSMKTFLAPSRRLRKKHNWPDELTFHHLLWFLLFLCVFSRTGGGVLLRLGSSSISTALWLSSLYTQTSPHNRHMVRPTPDFLWFNGLMCSAFRYFSLFLCSTRGIQTTNERRPILNAASPPPHDPGLPLHPRWTALPSRGGTHSLSRLCCRIRL